MLLFFVKQQSSKIKHENVGDGEKPEREEKKLDICYQLS